MRVAVWNASSSAKYSSWILCEAAESAGFRVTALQSYGEAFALQENDLLCIVGTPPLLHPNHDISWLRLSFVESLRCRVALFDLSARFSHSPHIITHVQEQREAIVRLLGSGAVAVACDTLTKSWLDSLVPEGRVFLGAPLASLVSPVETKRPYKPLVIGSDGGRESSASILERLRKASRQSRWIQFARPEQSISTLAAPGMDLVLCGSSYSAKLCAEVFRNAERALVFSLEEAVLATSAQTPTLLIADALEHTRVAQELGISVFRHLESEAELSFRRRLSEYLDNCKCQTELLAAYREELLSALGTLGLFFPRTAGTSQSFADYQIACISDRKYCASLLGFLENVYATEKTPRQIHLLAIDDETKEFAIRELGHLPMRIYRPEDLWGPEDLEKLRSRGVSHLAFASKAELLKRSLSATSLPCFYFDLDIYLYESPAKMLEAFAEHSVLLFPQWNDHLDNSKKYGVFNAGILGVTTGSQHFLRWWSEMCLSEYCESATSGYYVDQGILDLAPSLFAEVGVYREARHNVAPWNIRTLLRAFDAKDPRAPELFNGSRAASYHASSPDELGLFETKTLWDQICCLGRELPIEARNSLEHDIAVQQARHWLSLSRLLALSSWLPERIANQLVRPSWTRWVTNPLASSVLSVLAHIHYPLRTLHARLEASADSESQSRSRWISLQRRNLVVTDAIVEASASQPDAIEPSSIPLN